MATQDSQAFNLKKRIHDGQSILGVSVPMTIGREKLESALDSGPYDFVWVDGQHSAYSEDRLVSFCAMAADIGVNVQFRIKHTRQTYLIGNYLDLGPAGVEVPQVEHESTVDDAVGNFYYPQVGVRSWGGRSRLGIDGRSDRLQYAEWWGQTGVLWIQVESAEAVTKARKLAKPGVDCLSFGPADLSFSLESNPVHPLKTVDDCVQHVVDQLRDTSAAVCFRIASHDERQKYTDMGVTVLLIPMTA